MPPLARGGRELLEALAAALCAHLNTQVMAYGLHLADPPDLAA